jgi:histidine ammonia-lyase
LALINGTQFVLAHAVAAVQRFHSCLDLADLAGALSLETRLGSERPFFAELHALRPHRGVQYVARRLSGLLAGSQIVASHAGCPRVQDPYSLRCIPQVHGASRAAWFHLADAVAVEINSVTDNPVIVSGGEAISGGNFHAQPLALPIDYAALAASELGNISDRRSYLLLEGDGDALPRLLLADTGLQSGFMILQYTSAALASENKNLCFPAAADSIPTSLGQEDHVSMGSIGARKLHRILDHLELILAVEILCASQGLDFRRPLRTGPVLESCHAAVREVVSHAEHDRVFSADLDRVVELVRSGELIAAARAAQESAGIDLGATDFPEFTEY